MRYVLLAAVAAMGFAGAAPANAKWECVGPAVACSGSTAPKAAKAPRYSKAAYKQQRQAQRAGKVRNVSSDRTAKPRRERVAKANRGNYSGGGGGMTGMASYYWQGQRVASGGMFNPNALTAAHKTLPFGTKVRVTNLRNGKTVDVTINDRGPFVKGRVIDLSSRAAGVIGMKGAGVAPVSVAVIN